MKLLVVNGPNMNLLGMRNVEVYGSATLDEINANITEFAAGVGAEVDFYQSNSEGDIIDVLQGAPAEYDGVVLNAAAYTHYSIAIRDAIEAIDIVVVEVHMSDINAREEFRKVDVLEEVCAARFMGQGLDSYLAAVEYLVAHA